MIDNNTLYTQYKPSHPAQACQGHEPNLISTSSASSTSTASCSSTSSASSYSAALANQTNEHSRTYAKPYFANNRRESLFYHSTDNYRYNTPVLNNIEQQNIREKQKKILEQQHLNQYNQAKHVSRTVDTKALPNYQNNKIVMHSTPVNVSNQVHTICDMFEQDLNVLKEKNSYFVNNFNRYNRNQLSTKSNPPLASDHQGLVNRNETIIEDEYFHRNFKTNFNQNFHNSQLNFNLQTPVILPQPAQV